MRPPQIDRAPTVLAGFEMPLSTEEPPLHQRRQPLAGFFEVDQVTLDAPQLV